jgi:hypothetical protein
MGRGAGIVLFLHKFTKIFIYECLVFHHCYATKASSRSIALNLLVIGAGKPCDLSLMSESVQLQQADGVGQTLCGFIGLISCPFQPPFPISRSPDKPISSYDIMTRAIGTEKRRDILSVLVLDNQPITERSEGGKDKR